MHKDQINIKKASGRKVRFSAEKVAASLRRSGADQETIDHILQAISSELYEGISTKEIYNRAFQMLKNRSNLLASKYKLKKAIFELGPTGFPFEKFIGAILFHSGYQVDVGVKFQGKCVSHEVDVHATRDGEDILMECKFHSLQGKFSDVKVPLYIHSRFRDIEEFYNEKPSETFKFKEGWVATNTRFSADARKYANCVGLKLLSWDLPKGKALKDKIDQIGLFPITVSSLLSSREKQFLLSRDVVLCRELLNDDFYLDHLGISEKRKARILNEMENLCKV